ncbi:hypothetical protein N656DRAFT_398537 [Canariomyces notabilis]|uniref:Uncharacterized protein n=1 Tax=Canariomyces notabilis TaxID=2074819 RepID=A0AAN6TKT1_9PEZI|nr:hypothetical protein N656DRAFT_398537 [Canariomyces arenarius]
MRATFWFSLEPLQLRLPESPAPNFFPSAPFPFLPLVITPEKSKQQVELLSGGSRNCASVPCIFRQGRQPESLLVLAALARHVLYMSWFDCLGHDVSRSPTLRSGSPPEKQHPVRPSGSLHLVLGPGNQT